MMTRIKARNITKTSKSSKTVSSSTEGATQTQHRKEAAAETIENPQNTMSTYNHNHEFAQEEKNQFRIKLLLWYDRNKRDLQWRRLAEHPDRNVRAYSVLVSEIMLQQTQVSTVKPYYAKWIGKWPDVHSLSRATLEEVHELWAGLGYYSRGRRLHEAACKIVNELGGNVPSNSKDLEKKLPGVGRYTAAAVASIAFKEKSGIVDGNVTRVLTRMRAIGSDTKAQGTLDLLWQLADVLVDPDRPGDFNQALMELGATVCTPKNPACDKCPVSSLCGSYQRTNGCKIVDIEDCCKFCPPSDQPWDKELGVLNFPRKGKKTRVKEACNITYIVSRSSGTDLQYFLWQRPKTGLLASLWEFPNFPEKDSVDCATSTFFANKIRKISQHVGEVFHQFSHISQTYVVYLCEKSPDFTVQLPEGYQNCRWMTESELETSAISTAMKKVFRSLNKTLNKNSNNKRKTESHERSDGKRQMTLASFIQRKS